MLIYIVIFLIAYLFGSIPTAFIFIKLTQKKDIRREGSGNVGAMNALRTSKSRLIGLLVMLFDIAKGVLPMWFVLNYYGYLPQADLVTVSGLVLGHVYPVWLKFKGGRGLAVAAGALLVINWQLVVIWLIIWLFFFVMIQKHIVASLVSTFLLPIIVYFMREEYFSNHILLMTLIVTMLIFQRHLERIPDLVEQKRESINNGAGNGN